MMHPYQRSMRHSQRGAVLFVAMVFLVLLALLAVAASGTSVLQEKMTGSLRNRQLGLMGSESALRGAESKIWNLAYNASTSRPSPPCVTGDSGVNCVYPVLNGHIATLAQTFRTSKAWIPGPSDTPSGIDGAQLYAGAVSGLTGADETASLSVQPRFIIENMGPDVPPGAGRRGGAIQQERAGQPGFRELFRITARSQGGNDAVVRAAESVFSAATPSTYTPPVAP